MNINRLATIQIIGCPTGIALTFGIGGIIVDKLGWQSLFYLTGVLCLIWCITWFFVVEDFPEKHKFIKQKEKDYILLKRSKTVSDDKTIHYTPWLKIISSVPVLARICQDFIASNF